MYDYIPFLQALSSVDDVRPILKQLNEGCQDNDINITYGLQIIDQYQREMIMGNRANNGDSDNDVAVEGKDVGENFVDSPRQSKRF